jgi:hypothetical protein
MQQLKMSDATNTNPTTGDDNEDDDGFVDHDSVLLKGIRRAPDTLDFSRKRKFGSVKFQLPEKEEPTLNEIIEECEYDSDIGKFKCKDDEAIDPDGSENSSTSSMVDHYLDVEHMNDLNSPFKCVNRNNLDTNNIDEMNGASGDDGVHYKIVMKRIEFFEPTKTPNGVADSHGEADTDVVDGATAGAYVWKPPTPEDQLLSTVLLSIFILTVALLIIFPLPN